MTVCRLPVCVRLWVFSFHPPQHPHTTLTTHHRVHLPPVSMLDVVAWRHEIGSREVETATPSRGGRVKPFSGLSSAVSLNLALQPPPRTNLTTLPPPGHALPLGIRRSCLEGPLSASFPPPSLLLVSEEEEHEGKDEDEGKGDYENDENENEEEWEEEEEEEERGEGEGGGEGGGKGVCLGASHLDWHPLFYVSLLTR